MPIFIPILYVLGGAVIRAAAPAAARALISLGAKKVSTKAAQAIGGKIVTATPKVLKQLKTKVKKPTTKPVTKKEVPPNVKVKKIPKSAKPFNKKTQKQKDAQKKREETQKQNMKNENRRNPGRDPKGKFDKKPVTSSNVPRTGGAKKGGLKSRLDAKAKRAAMGVGLAAVKAENLSSGEIEIGPRKNTKVTPKTGQGRPSMDKNKNKRKIPVVKPKEGPMKVRPKESDQPKKGMTFGQAFNDARTKKKDPTFSWENPKTGKTGKYTTRLKEESIADHKKKFGVTGKY